eukprot:XP_008179891.2 PREDICTED: uncharacterized protein LOC100574267 [Acyrthosiphon pisum]
MWFWKTFVISFSLASIWLDRGICAPYNYFDVGDIVANSDIRRSWSESDSRKTRLAREVSETKSTNNPPTRGLFYPDDMFFTHWVPSVSNEECSENLSSGTTPSCSISKSALQTKNNDKSTEHQTTLGQQKSTTAVESSLRHQHTSTSGMLSSSSDEPTSTVAVPNSSRGRKTSAFSVSSSSTEEQMSTSDVQYSTSRVQTSSFGVQSSTSNLKTSKFARPSSPRRKKTTKFVPPNLPRRRKQSTVAVPSFSRHYKTVTFFVVPNSPIGHRGSRFDGQSTTSSPLNYDFGVASSTNGQRKYSLHNSSRLQRKYTFDVENSSKGHRKPTRSPATTMEDYTPDMDYFSYSEEKR